MTATSILTITYPTVGTVDILYLDGGLKHQGDKILQIIPVPETTDEQGLPLVWLVDLRRIQETITVIGILEDETGNTMWDKKLALRKIINAGGTMTIRWNLSDTQQPYTVNVTKYAFTEKVGRIGDDSTEQMYMEVTIVFVIGQTKPN